MADISKNTRFFKLYNSIQAPLRSFILMIVHNENDADDVLQTTAGILWEKFDQYEPGTNFRAWAYKVAKNQSLVLLRKRRKTGMEFSDEIAEKIAEFAEKTPWSSHDRKKALSECMDKLNSTDQVLLQMRYQKNLAVKEIAGQTGRSINGFYKTLTRIHSVLKECIDRTIKHGQII